MANLRKKRVQIILKTKKEKRRLLKDDDSAHHTCLRVERDIHGSMEGFSEEPESRED